MSPKIWKVLDKKAMSSIELHLSDEVIYNYGEDDKAILLLRALPHSFKHFMITLLFGNENLACDAVVSDIIFYMKLNKTSEREAKEEGLFKESSEQG
ncbi:hypothetical protein ACOSQ2_021639 [Xanthoceras sorbifolium]